MSNPYEAMTPGAIESAVDKGFRHKPMAEHVFSVAFRQHILGVARHFAYATHDGSWGEFEKEFAIIIKRLVIAERALKLHQGEIDVPVMTELLRDALNDKGLTITMSGDAKPVHNDHSLCELASALISNFGVEE